MTNTELLRQIIAESGYKYNFIAEHLGLSRYGLALKIDNKIEFKVSEVASLSELLNLTWEQKEKIFFATKVEDK